MGRGFEPHPPHNHNHSPTNHWMNAQTASRLDWLDYTGFPCSVRLRCEWGLTVEGDVMRATGRPGSCTRQCCSWQCHSWWLCLSQPHVADEGESQTPSRAVMAAPSAERAPQNEKKVTICHRTNSRTNTLQPDRCRRVGCHQGATPGTGARSFGPDVDDWGDIVARSDPDCPLVGTGLRVGQSSTTAVSWNRTWAAAERHGRQCHLRREHRERGRDCRQQRRRDSPGVLQSLRQRLAGQAGRTRRARRARP